MKNLKKKNVISKLMLLALILSSLIFSGYKVQSPIKIYVNGHFLESDQPPILFEDRVFVPVRVIAENLGAKVGYNKDDMTVTIERGNTNIKFSIGDDTAWISNEKKSGPALLNAAPFLKNNRIYLPLRSISELFGMHVDWNGAKRAVYINEESYLVDYINEDNAGDEVLERLRELGIIGDGSFYVEASDYEIELANGKDKGYFVTVRKDNPIYDELTELVGHYYINKKGTLLMEYNVVEDKFELLIGVNWNRNHNKW